MVTGYPDSTFRAAEGVTRAQAVVMLWKVAGRPVAATPPPYSDVSPDAWFAESLSWADGHGIVTGFPDGTFRGGASVSRAQLTVQLSALAHTEAAWAVGRWSSPARWSSPPETRRSPGAGYSDALSCASTRAHSPGFSSARRPPQVAP